MLVTEKQMNEGEGILIASPALGLGYQIAGAYQRLGSRIQGLFRDQEELKEVKHVPMQSLVYDWRAADFKDMRWPGQRRALKSLVISPFPELSFNQEISLDLQQKIEDLTLKVKEENPELEIVLVLPKAGPAALIQKLQDAQTMILLSPAVFSFRDRGMFDESLRRIEENPASFFSEEDAPLDLTYAGDLAGFVISAPQNPQLRGKIIEVPSSVKSLKAWRESFAAAFEVKASSLQKFKNRVMKSKEWEDFLSKFSASRAPLEAESATEVFPTVMTPLDRALRQLAQNFRRHPELDLVFAPSRAL